MRACWVVLFLALGVSLRAQMVEGNDTLYGPEWIRYDQRYFKIPVAEDQLWRIGYQDLLNAGIPLAGIPGSHFQLFCRGKEVPLYASQQGALQSGDYFLFWGQKNRGEMDAYLYPKAADQWNPYYSLVSDTAWYYLSWTDKESPLRITELPNDLSNPPPKTAFYMAEEILASAAEFVKKPLGEVYLSSFSAGESYTDGYAQSRSYAFNNIDPYVPAGGNARLDIKLVSSNNSHQLSVLWDNLQIYSEDFYGFVPKLISQELSLGEVSGSHQLHIKGLLNEFDRLALASAKLTYPRAFDAKGGSRLAFSLAGSGPRYLEVGQFNGGSGPVYLYDKSNRTRIAASLENGLYRLGFDNALNEAQYELIAENQIRPVSGLQEVAFTDYSNWNADLVILTHPSLRQGSDPVQAYADYRQSQTGGNYQTRIVEVGALYEQFGYGIQRHFQALRNFIAYLARKPQPPQAILILGKGREFNAARTGAQLASPDNASFLVPTFGYPGSDNMLASADGSGRPDIAIGRIAASSPGDVALYLQKVRDFEANQKLPQSIEERAWMKEIIHLGGGGGASEQSSIKANLAELQEIAEENMFGAHVNNLFKTTSDPIQIPDSKRLFDWISNGVSVMTFFGHSGVGGFDIALDAPSKYNNYKKYPLVLSLGCYVGQIHTAQLSFSEGFVLAPDRGGIAMWASTSEAYISSLQSAARQFYQLMGGPSYGEPIGKLIRQSLWQIPINQFGVPELIHQITYHGDPLLRLNPHPGADFVPDASSVRINPASPDAQQDSFQLQFALRNIGKALYDSVTVEIRREFPDQSITTVFKEALKAPANTETYTIQLPVLGDRAVGRNRLLLSIDPDQLRAELPLPDAELNNELQQAPGKEGIEFFIVANGIRPVFPPDFSIQPTPPVLKASTTQVFAGEQTYVFELDTLADFSSPLKQQQKITRSGGLIPWTVNPGWESGRVYYWRVSLDSIEGQGYDWQRSSFIYLPGSSPGWNQSHFGQFAQDRFNNLEQAPNKQLKFEDDLKTISVINGVYPNTWPALTVNNDVYVYLPWDDPIIGGIYVAVFDSSTAQPWINIPPGDYGSHVSPWAYWAAYPYWTNEAESREKAMAFIRDVIPPRSYVLIYTVQHQTQDYEPQEWANDSISNGGSNLFNLLEKQGATLIRSTATEGAKPYVLLYRKDDPGFPVFEKMVEKDQSIDEKLNIYGNWYIGNLESTQIGPAREWTSLRWKVSAADANDTYSADIIGVRPDKSFSVLAAGVNKDTVLNFVNAAEYPYLRLRFNAKDSLTRTAANLDFWRVHYRAQPDIALEPDAETFFYKDTLQQGDTMRLSMRVRNLGQESSDSLRLHYTVSSTDNTLVSGESLLGPLGPDGSAFFHIRQDTRSLLGPQLLQFEIEDYKQQPEEVLFNNNGLRPFLVLRDIRNPLLDVTFDGRKILNGDLVSAEPEITVLVRDENRFLGLTDTAQFKLVLTYPDQSVHEIPASDPRVQFIPADTTQLDKKNEARLIYKAKLEQDGEYSLLVQSSDISGNVSGSQDYKVRFKVINQSMISNLVNYPNPFSTSTRFVYTLTGAIPPPDYSIQVYTVSGRLIRELTQFELGPLQVGTHMTQGTWDGTDQYGDRLANGVYIYRLRVKDAQGKALERYEIQSVDALSTKGFSKMVLMR